MLYNMQNKEGKLDSSKIKMKLETLINFLMKLLHKNQSQENILKQVILQLDNKKKAFRFSNTRNN